MEQFNQLLKAKIIQTRFQVSVNGNNFITKDNLQLQDIQVAEVILFFFMKLFIQFNSKLKNDNQIKMHSFMQ